MAPAPPLLSFLLFGAILHLASRPFLSLSWHWCPSFSFPFPRLRSPLLSALRAWKGEKGGRKREGVDAEKGRGGGGKRGEGWCRREGRRKRRRRGDRSREKGKEKGGLWCRGRKRRRREAEWRMVPKRREERRGRVIPDSCEPGSILWCLVHVNQVWVIWFFRVTLRSRKTL